MVDIYRVWDQNFQVYGARKIWRQMHRENMPIARCTVERLMGRQGIEGVRRGKRIRTTVPDASRPCPRDLVRRAFHADRPNRLLRQYFPKGTDLSRWSAEEIQAVAHTLNTRPRKTLGWKTPAETLNEHLQSIQQPSVATTG
jgi:Transposase and inactivated derivatives, IS30 family